MGSRPLIFATLPFSHVAFPRHSRPTLVLASHRVEPTFTLSQLLLVSHCVDALWSLTLGNAPLTAAFVREPLAPPAPLRPPTQPPLPAQQPPLLALGGAALVPAPAGGSRRGELSTRGRMARQNGGGSEEDSVAVCG